MRHLADYKFKVKHPSSFQSVIVENILTVEVVTMTNMRAKDFSNRVAGVILDSTGMTSNASLEILMPEPISTFVSIPTKDIYHTAFLENNLQTVSAFEVFEVYHNSIEQVIFMLL